MVRKMFVSMHVWIYICKKSPTGSPRTKWVSMDINRKFHYWWGKIVNMSELSPQDTALIPTTLLLFKMFLEFFLCDYFQNQFISYMRKINCANFLLTKNRIIWLYHPPCSSGLTSRQFRKPKLLSQKICWHWR